MLWNCGAGEDFWESLDCKDINPVNPKGNQPEYSLEGLMLKLKFQYFGHLMQRADSVEKTLKLGKIQSKGRRGWQRMRWLASITDSMDMNLSKLQEIVKDREGWHATVHRVASSWGHPLPLYGLMTPRYVSEFSQGELGCMFPPGTNNTCTSEPGWDQKNDPADF